MEIFLYLTHHETTRSNKMFIDNLSYVKCNEEEEDPWHWCEHREWKELENFEVGVNHAHNMASEI